MNHTAETDGEEDRPPSELSREETKQQYGTLNPGGTLMNSDALEAEVNRIVESSAADDGEIVRCNGQDHAVVELVFQSHTAGVELGVFDDENSTGGAGEKIDRAVQLLRDAQEELGYPDNSLIGPAIDQIERHQATHENNVK